MPAPAKPAVQDRTFGTVRRRVQGHRGLDPFYTGLLDGVDGLLDAHHAHILVHIVTTLEEELATYRRWAENGTVEGVVLSDLVDDDSRPALCRELGLRTVLVGGGDYDGHLAIRVDNDAAMTGALTYLADLGHRAIGRVGGPAAYMHTRVRSDAFERELARLSIDGWIVEGDYSADSGAECTRALLDAHPELTAIIYDNDVMAEAALDVARERGRSVPEALSILAWDDSAVCQLAEPELSAVSRDVRGLGELIGRALLDVEGGESVTQDTVVIGRGSTGPAPSHA
jgi:DNA-binding LacI/PurR family transcriptional regulator